MQPAIHLNEFVTENTQDKYQDVLSPAKDSDTNNFKIQTIIQMSKNDKSFKIKNKLYDFHQNHMKWFFHFPPLLLSLITLAIFQNTGFSDFSNLLAGVSFFYILFYIIFGIINMIIETHFEPRLSSVLRKNVLSFIDFNDSDNFNTEKRLANVFQFLRTVDNSAYATKSNLSLMLMGITHGVIINKFEDSLRHEIKRRGAHYGNIRFWLDQAIYSIANNDSKQQEEKEIALQNKHIERLL